MEIEFSLLENYSHIEHKPLPATKCYPDWFKAMPAVTADGKSTLKRCPPITDIIGMGYIIPVHAEFQLTPHLNGGYHVDTRMPYIENPFEGNRVSLEYQFPQQFKGSPWEPYQIIKLTTPWVVKTPPGYSILILPLLGEHEADLIPLPAIIDTDQYHVSVGITCKVKFDSDKVILLKPGQPLVQIIPFKRDDWTSKYTIQPLIQHAKIANKLRTFISSGYRRFWHKTKIFK